MGGSLRCGHQSGLPIAFIHRAPGWPEFNSLPVRIVQIDGEPWFVAKDVCDVLDIANPSSSLALLDDDEKGLHTVETLRGMQSLATVNEPGLYSLILRSRKPEAKAFKRWVTHEVHHIGSRHVPLLAGRGESGLELGVGCLVGHGVETTFSLSTPVQLGAVGELEGGGRTG